MDVCSNVAHRGTATHDDRPQALPKSRRKPYTVFASLSSSSQRTKTRSDDANNPNRDPDVADAALVGHCATASNLRSRLRKPNKEGGGPYVRSGPGRLIMTYYSIQELVAFAYGVRTEQVVGQSFSDRYNIEF